MPSGVSVRIEVGFQSNAGWVTPWGARTRQETISVNTRHDGQATPLFNLEHLHSLAEDAVDLSPVNLHNHDSAIDHSLLDVGIAQVVMEQYCLAVTTPCRN